jgi:hypothetical protein
VVPRIWAYAAAHQPDGNFSDYSAQEIASLIFYDGDAKQMLQALLQAGFFDAKPLRIHDWHRYNGILDFFSKRASKAADARWAKEREKQRGKEQSKAKHSIAETSIAPSNASSMLQASDDNTLFNRIEAAKQKLNPLYKRTRLIWPNDDERLLADAIASNPDWEKELSELLEWRNKLDDKKFFPQSVASMLTKWSGHLDRARAHETERPAYPQNQI